MLERREIQVILERFAGREWVAVPGDSLGQPWRAIYGRLLPLAKAEAMRPTGDE